MSAAARTAALLLVGAVALVGCRGGEPGAAAPPGPASAPASAPAPDEFAELEASASAVAEEVGRD